MRSSPFLPIFLIIFVDVLGLTMLMPLLPFYAQHLGATPQQVGWLIGVYALFQLLAGPPLGNLSDRIGRKPVLLFSQVGTLFGFLLLAWTSTLWVAFVSRIIDGITAGNLSVAQAYITDISRPSERTKGFAIMGVAFGMGFLIGPAACGYLATYGDHLPIWVASGLSALSILTTALILPAKPPRPELTAEEEAQMQAMTSSRKLSLLDWGGYLEYFRRPRLAPLLWMFFAYVMSFSLFTSGFALFCERRLTYQGHPFGTQEVGYLLAYVGVLGILLQGGLVGRLVKRFGETPLILPAFAMLMVGFSILAFTFDIPMLVLSATVTAFGALARVLLSGLISQAVARQEQGVTMGLTQSLTSLSAVIGPVLAGYLIGHGLLFTWALGAAALAAIGLAIRAWTPLPDARTGTQG